MDARGIPARLPSTQRMSDPLILVESLYKVFGPRPKHALQLLEQGLPKAAIFEKTGMTIGVQDASFEIHEGEIFVIMGLSGSGKSTLLRLLNRLIEPTAGKVLIEGRDVTRMGPGELIEVRRRKMAMVFQSFALLPHLSVWENAAFGLEVSGMERSERKQRALAALEQVGLSANADSYPSELSGGMQQRVGLARALATDPAVLLMDEAFSALDPLIRTEMQDELLKLQAEHSRTVVFISHDLDEAMRIGDRIAIMEGGRVLQVGTAEEILKDPADDYVRSFFRGVDVANVYKAGDIARHDQVTLIQHSADGVRTALQQLRDYDREFGFVRDKDGCFRGVVSVGSLMEEAKGDNPRLDRALLDVEPVDADASFGEVIKRVAESAYPVPVVDDKQHYLGVISKTALLRTLEKTP